MHLSGRADAVAVVAAAEGEAVVAVGEAAAVVPGAAGISSLRAVHWDALFRLNDGMGTTKSPQPKWHMKWQFETSGFHISNGDEDFQ